MEPTVTKRLHISGLTPSVSKQDLTQRLSTFGNVKSLDGLGALDAVGQPKKFAYATLEATPAKVSKCLNSLSGSTWKGAKLRIGEAKLDFRERVHAENEKFAALEPRRKKSRWKYAPYHATHSKDMSLVTLEKAKLKGSWVVTPLGRVYRPLRMRPPRPLPPMASASAHLRKDLKGKGKEVKGKGVLKKKRIKKLDIRARRRKIDMVKYGSEYLKGKFLDVDVPFGVGPSTIVQEVPVQSYEESSDEESDQDMIGAEAGGDERSGEDQEVDEETKENETPERPAFIPASILPHAPSTTEPKSKATSTPNTTSFGGIDLNQEKSQSLDLLASLFGSSTINDEDDDNWIGQESLDSDIDEAVVSQTRVQHQTSQTDTVDFEIVPRDGARGKRHLQEEDQAATAEDADVDMEDTGLEEQEDTSVKEYPVNKPSAAKAPEQAPTAPKKLKDLFAPNDNEGGFSLLGHLNLDDELELDEDVPFSLNQETDAPLPDTQVMEHQTISVPTTTTSSAKTDSGQTRQISQITLDPSQPLFFPLALLATHPAAADASFVANPDAKNRPKDLFDTARARGWDWLSSGFYRTQTEDEIRQQWEEQKGELTQGWKKRWREAGRVGRRRGKVGGGEDG
ncbi:hypothetical protein D9756_002109 [Leucocoprinus leucothites]|uniref:RRM domain-containing protein n=1 Tax=Leucocoprinus leucothites TaxID=201217 RepID=A0A8H5LLY2_9AGAR|nr:hypothetical protein D9756_002109 [Leucoagaricus leucothites]